MPKYRPGRDDDGPRTERIRRQTSGEELPVDAGVPHGGHNVAYGDRGQALRDAQQRAEQTGGEVVHDQAHAPGQTPHYHVQNPDNTRQPGHIFHGGPAKRVRKPDRLVTRVQGDVVDRRAKRRFEREAEAEAELESMVTAVHRAASRREDYTGVAPWWSHGARPRG